MTELKDKTPIILVLSGSFNPVHSGHVAILVKCKEYMEKNYNYVVKAAYLAPSSDTYVKGKLKNWAMKLEHRAKLCEIVAAKYPWMKVCSFGIASGYATGKILAKQEKVPFFEVCGADFIARTKIWAGRNLICLGRKGSSDDVKKTLEDTDEKSSFIFIDQEVGDISSTEIRKYLNMPTEEDWNKVVEKKLIDKKELDYIIANFDNLFIK
jgi:nicotinic acid mononucleotide adenylyltransferase